MYILQLCITLPLILRYLPGPLVEIKCKKSSGTGTERTFLKMSYYFRQKTFKIGLLYFYNGCIINLLPESYHLINTILFPIISNTSHFSLYYPIFSYHISIIMH